MLFFDITEYSQPATDKRQTMAATTTMTPGSQFYWRQSNPEQHGNPEEAEATATYYDDDSNPSSIPPGDYYDQEEPAFNHAAANRATTSNVERRRQQRHSPLRNTNQAIPATDIDAAEVKPAHECVQKPKTRAERRAIDAPLTEPEVLQPVTKRERRSDYWVQRDDERRNAARTFKTQTQSQVLNEEDEDEDEDCW